MIDTSKSDSLYAAYDALDFKNAKCLIVVSSNYFYMPVYCFGQK